MGESMWGRSTWRGEYARFAGVSFNTIWRWLTGEIPIPRVHAQLMMYRYKHYVEKGMAYPNHEAPWLDEDWVPYGDTIPVNWDDDNDDD
jgi:hypothetical protein